MFTRAVRAAAMAGPTGFVGPTTRFVMGSYTEAQMGFNRQAVQISPTKRHAVQWAPDGFDLCFIFC